MANENGQVNNQIPVQNKDDDAITRRGFFGRLFSPIRNFAKNHPIITAVAGGVAGAATFTNATAIGSALSSAASAVGGALSSAASAIAASAPAQATAAFFTGKSVLWGTTIAMSAGTVASIGIGALALAAVVGVGMMIRNRRRSRNDAMPKLQGSANLEPNVARSRNFQRKLTSVGLDQPKQELSRDKKVNKQRKTSISVEPSTNKMPAMDRKSREQRGPSIA